MAANKVAEWLLVAAVQSRIDGAADGSEEEKAMELNIDIDSLPSDDG